MCVYRGCIPSKALLHVAKLIEEAAHASAWGVEFGAPKIDLDKLRAFKDGVVGKLTGGTGQLAEGAQGQVPAAARRRSTGPTSLDVAKVDGGTEARDVRARHRRHRLAAGRRCRACRSTARA